MQDSSRLPGRQGGVEAEWDGGASDRAAWAEAVWEDDARGMPWIAADGEQASIPDGMPGQARTLYCVTLAVCGSQEQACWIYGRQTGAWLSIQCRVRSAPP